MLSIHVDTLSVRMYEDSGQNKMCQAVYRVNTKAYKYCTTVTKHELDVNDVYVVP